MRLGTKNRLAVDTMIDLGLRDGGAPVPLAAVSGRLQVSLSYLEQVVARLRQRGLVSPTRGPGGGYTLGRAPADITLAEIVAAVDDGDAQLAHGGSDALRELTARLADAMHDHMTGITLAALCQQQVARGVQIETRPPRRTTARPPALPRRPAGAGVPNSVFAFGRMFR